MNRQLMKPTQPVKIFCNKSIRPIQITVNVKAAIKPEMMNRKLSDVKEELASIVLGAGDVSDINFESTVGMSASSPAAAPSIFPV